MNSIKLRATLMPLKSGDVCGWGVRFGVEDDDGSRWVPRFLPIIWDDTHPAIRGWFCICIGVPK